MRGKKTHVYRVAGMIASIRGKKPHVYRVIILKQMADHKYDRGIDKTLGSISAVSRSVGGSFFRTAASNRAY